LGGGIFWQAFGSEKEGPRILKNEGGAVDILLVDDNTDYLDVVRDVLHTSGYHVHTAKDGIEGCELLSSSDIDLIISDIQMPRLDGLKLHAFARETDQHRNTKFIFLTGLKDFYADKLRLAPGSDYLVEKTSPVKDLLRLVDTLLFGGYQEVWV
jgi:CheY-like chemotaxis protein